MATKSIVPRADNEGGIGEDTTPKYWKEGYFYDLYLKGLSVAKTTTAIPVPGAPEVLSSIESIVNPSGDCVASVFYALDVGVETLDGNTEDIGLVAAMKVTADHYSEGAMGSVDGVVSTVTVHEDSGAVTLTKGVWGSSVISHGAGGGIGVQGDVYAWGGNLTSIRGGRFKVQVAGNDAIGLAPSANTAIAMDVDTIVGGTATYAGTINTYMSGINLGQYFGAFSVVPLAYGINLLTPDVTVQPTNYYGLYMGDHSGVGSVINWAIYVAGGDSYLGGNLTVTGSYQVDGVQVVSNRVIDARCDDVINSGDVTTDGVIDALRDAMIAHGLIAAA